jgi:epoxide hydrolase-like predicted phosphatase
MIKVVLFDFGGVLTETGKRGFITGIIADIFGVPPETIDISDLHADLRRGKMQEAEFFDAINHRYGTAQKQLTKQDFVARTEIVTLSPGVIGLAGQLRDSGIRTGILSNVFAVNARRLEARGYYDGFDPIILSCDAGFAKPDKEIYDFAIQKLGVLPHEILFIDDQEKCTTAAAAIGMHVVVAESPEQIVRDIKKVLKEQNGLNL